MSNPSSLNTPADTVSKRLSRARWINLPGFAWGTHEGLRDFRFGARAGPEIGFQHLAHEIAHAVELVGQGQLDRLSSHGYGFRLAKVEVLGEEYDNPTTMQATERECRTAGIQMHIMESAGLRIASFAYEFADTMVRFMPDWWFGGSSDKERTQRRAELVIQSYGSWDKAMVRHAWSEVCARIQEQRQVQATE